MLHLCALYILHYINFTDLHIVKDTSEKAIDSIITSLQTKLKYEKKLCCTHIFLSVRCSYNTSINKANWTLFCLHRPPLLPSRRGSLIYHAEIFCVYSNPSPSTTIQKVKQNLLFIQNILCLFKCFSLWLKYQNLRCPFQALEFSNLWNDLNSL